MSDRTDLKMKRGRPPAGNKKDGATSVREYRKRMNIEKSRFDIYIGLSASNIIKKLAESWNYTTSQVIERLILESSLKYKAILHPPEDYPDGLPDHVLEDIINEKLNEMLASKRFRAKSVT